MNQEASALLYTDGGCWPNPGSGGWGVVALFAGQYQELDGGKLRTTSNEMELTAIREGLIFATTKWRATRVTVCSDSRYAINCLTRWHQAWRRAGWITARTGAPVKNKDLIDEITSFIAVQGLNVRFEWVRGHAGNVMNERADELASHYCR